MRTLQLFLTEKSKPLSLWRYDKDKRNWVRVRLADSTKKRMQNASWSILMAARKRRPNERFKLSATKPGGKPN